MGCKTVTRQAMLRGVYEDNLGIPRSSLGKRRSRPIPAPQRPRERSWNRGKLILIALFGVAILLGINFRLVSVDDSGPVAMQVERPPEIHLPAWASAGGDNAQETALPASSGPEKTLETATGTTEQYDTMLSQLGMPVADLFDLKVQTIVIDPGHGGIDPGATGHQGLREKDVVLDISRRLRDKLTRSGDYRVLLTREDDSKVFLKERVAFARENHADLFISIHINSVPVPSANYVETYYFGPHADQRSLDLAEKENRDSDYVMGEFREVIARIGDTLKTEESKRLATAIHKHLYTNLKRRNSDLVDARTKTGPFVVLLGVQIPSVLVEVSCISNKAEETRMSTPEYRDSVAGFLETGIVEYLERRAYRRTLEGGKIQHVAKQEK
jgi:N-acetylmuramoyl-L-alanine amidase